MTIKSNSAIVFASLVSLLGQDDTF